MRNRYAPPQDRRSAACGGVIIEASILILIIKMSKSLKYKILGLEKKIYMHYNNVCACSSLF